MAQSLPTLEIGPLSHSLEAAVISIGRAEDNMVVVDDASVSGHHAEIEQTDNGLILRDLGSTNGTRVNGVPVTETVIHEGDAVCFGSVDAVLCRACQSEFSAASETGLIADHIREMLDEQLQAGNISQADYHRKLEVLEVAGQMIQARSSSDAVSGMTKAKRARQATTPPPLPAAAATEPKPLARLVRFWNKLPFPEARHVLLMLCLMVLIYKTPPFLAGPAAVGYVFGAIACVLPYAVG
ncbi:MAG: FHA domain-containing protein, partial [Prosthecobacter sp.]|uniref:FHA domain-containing protein n=1 Tax=Prosthecobacter sp. TaxID=1965333 RepID=UPI001A022981